MPSRRTMILAAGGASLALVAGAGGWRVTRLPERALQPWDDAPVADPRLDMLRHAILAPNPHNRQPWRLHLIGADEMVVTCDSDRRLPATDPFDRQITIGFGCFLETARIAAAQRGQRLAVTPFPEGEPQPRLDARPIARLRLIADPAVPRDPLFAAIRHRRSTKLPYDMTRPVDPVALAAVVAQAGRPGAGHCTADARTAALRALVQQAIATEIDLPRTWAESARVMRIGHAEIDASPDGIALRGPMIEAMAAAGLIDHAALADPASLAFRSGRDSEIATYGAAPAFVWVTTPANDRISQLAAGRAYVRANLMATSLGLAMHPASQALQEFAEMREAFEGVHALIGIDPASGGRVQMLARIGHGPAVPPAPRWRVASRMVRA